jgi:ribosome-binding protein aMBF1 (putative translation factor)
MIRLSREGKDMAHATLNMNGKTFVLVPLAEYKKMTVPRSVAPEFPGPDESGNFPALQTGRVSIAREVIRRREAVGLSQKALAALVGIRLETLNRIERAQVTADTATIT